MGRSLSLAAYRALSRHRQELPGSADYPERNPGELVWCHATDPVRLSALCDIARRLKMMRSGLKVLISFDVKTVPADMPVPEGGGDWIAGIASDHPAAARRFLTHWHPDVCLWTGGKLLVNHISTAGEMGIRMILADAGETDFQSARHKWFPDLTRTSLDLFDTILTNSAAAARMIRRTGVAPGKVEAAARLRLSPLPPHCSDDELAGLLKDLNGRPVWLAAMARRGEFEAILAAHRAALRLSHRLLLILVLAEPGDMAELKSRIGGLRMRMADWDMGDSIEDNIQVLVCASADDLGLWYRIAPLTFLASSLTPEGGGIGPLEAAALGSAVLYGPHVGNHIDTYARLSAAGAGRSVNDGESLGAALLQLVAPDHAAAMALAGWDVATEGADLTDKLVDLVQDALDRNKAAHARA